jgi:hypothetical protein
MRKRGVAAGLALVALALAPGVARADSPVISQVVCTGTAFDVCNTFDLVATDNPGEYALTVTYTSTTANPGEEGVVTSAGLYSILASPSWNFTDVAVTGASGHNWGAGACNDLSGSPLATILACASADAPAPSNGLAVGESMTFTFHSDTDITADAFGPNGDLGFRSHVQAFGPNGCSLKPDSRIGVVDGVTIVDARCGGPTTTVPEPVTMVMVGTGLMGMGVIRRRKRSA